jgi:hypothetical protein
MSRAAFRLTDAGGIPDLHKSPTRLVCVVRQPLIWAMLVALFILAGLWPFSCRSAVVQLNATRCMVPSSSAAR